VTLLITVLVLGVLASLSPSTLVVFILLLATRRARVNAAAFLIGWSISLTFVFAASYMIGGNYSVRRSSGRAVVDVVEILLGLGLVALGAREWRRRDEPRAPSGVTADLEGRLKELRPVEAMVLGVLEQPWTLTAAAAVIVVNHHSALVLAVIAFALFTVASTATVGATYLYFARRPGQAAAHLDELRARVVAAGPALFAVVSVAVGAYLVIDGTVALVRR
jgi:hypothetical protein